MLHGTNIAPDPGGVVPDNSESSAAPVCASPSRGSQLMNLIIRDRNLIIRDNNQSDCTQTFCKMSRAAHKQKGGWFRYSESTPSS